MEIQFVDESEFQNDGKWYFYIDNSQVALCADVSGNAFPFLSKTKNNFRGIDISQPTPSMSLSVPSFSLGSKYWTLYFTRIQNNIKSGTLRIIYVLSATGIRNNAATLL